MAMFVSDFFLDELAKTVCGDGTLANLVVADIKLVNNVTDKVLASDSFTGTLSIIMDATTGRAKLENDLTFAVTDATVGGWIALDAAGTPNELFGADFATSEVFTGAGEFILEKDDTYVQIALKAT